MGGPVRPANGIEAMTETIVSHYKIIKEIGRGGMGEVYLAEDTKLERKVALKFLPRHLTEDKESRLRFEREAKAAAALNHPNIVTVYEIGEHEGQVFIAMEYVEGKTLKDIVFVGTGRDLSLPIASHPLPIAQVIAIATQIASGLAAAHAKGIVHRDIKPQNILVDKDGRIKILDFGLAKLKGVSPLTKESSTLGTVHYMSPEQAMGKDVDQRSDIWSFGVMLYEMLTGNLPFKGEYDQAVIYSILNEKPTLATAMKKNLPAELDHIFDKALAKDPGERYPRLDDLAADLKTLEKQIEGEKTGERPIRSNSWKRKLLPIGGGLVILLGMAFLAVTFIFKEKLNTIHSIAVLPLQNYSHDPEQDYFADGMTEALITELSKIKALRVISRTSAMLYKKSTKPLPEIARELKVDAVLEGSAQRVGDRIRITAQLIEAQTDRHLWADDFERDFRDILFLQKEVSRAITREIRIAVTPEESKQLSTARKVNAEAHEAYLKGLYLINKFTETDMNKGIAFFEEALQKDPEYALAYTGLAEAYDNLLFISLVRPKEILQKMKEYALKALSIDESLGEAHLVLAAVKMINDWDFPGAEREHKLALQFSPSYSTAYTWYACFMLWMGRNDEALTLIQRAQEIDPLSPAIRGFSGYCLYFDRQYDKAITRIKENLALEPNVFDSSTLGPIYLQKRMYEEAIACFKKAIDLGGGVMSEKDLACAYAFAGKPAMARNTLANLLKQSSKKYVSPDYIWQLYWALGEMDNAVTWLEKAAEERSPIAIMIYRDPQFEGVLHSHPRFITLMKKVGFEK
jgi:eukaryotic-like serine/threonine-protein kinase